MPIYKIAGQKKDGLQKYRVVVNYTDENGKKLREKTTSAPGACALPPPRPKYGIKYVIAKRAGPFSLEKQGKHHGPAKVW